MLSWGWISPALDQGTRLGEQKCIDPGAPSCRRISILVRTRRGLHSPLGWLSGAGRASVNLVKCPVVLGDGQGMRRVCKDRCTCGSRDPAESCPWETQGTPVTVAGHQECGGGDQHQEKAGGGQGTPARDETGRKKSPVVQVLGVLCVPRGGPWAVGPHSPLCLLSQEQHHLPHQALSINDPVESLLVPFTGSPAAPWRQGNEVRGQHESTVRQVAPVPC